MRRATSWAALLALGAIAVVLALVASPLPAVDSTRDVFGFSDLASEEGARAAPLPALEFFEARDGASPSDRLYDAPSDRTLIFLHGSSYHGAGYHALGMALSGDAGCRVVIPTLRGHHRSGPRRGDVDYIGQLEDDLLDLMARLQERGQGGTITLGGHSSGGGLALRFAGGGHEAAVAGFVLLSPVIPTSDSVKGGDAGGWARLHHKRHLGLLVLNTLGVEGLNALPIIVFNKPAALRDGSETLSYSYRLTTSMHPRFDYARDLEAAQRHPLLVLIGDRDEAIDAETLRSLFAPTPDTLFEVLPDTGHFDVFRSPASLGRIAGWLSRR